MPSIFGTTTRFPVSRTSVPGAGVAFIQGTMGKRVDRRINLGWRFSNETAALYEYPNKARGGVYLGIGSHQNFDHIWRTRPDAAVIVDETDEVADHLTAFAAMIKICSKNPFEFLALLSSRYSLNLAAASSSDPGDQFMGLINKHLFMTDRELSNATLGFPNIRSGNMNYASAFIGDPEVREILNALLDAQCRPLPEPLKVETYSRGCQQTPDIEYVARRNTTQRLFDQTFCYRYLGRPREWQKYQNDWLRNIQAYLWLHNFISSGKLAVIRGSIADPSVIACIGRALSDIPGLAGPQKIRTAYLTNCEAGLAQDELPGYFSGLGALPWADDPMVLRSHHEFAQSGGFPFVQNDGFTYQVLSGPLARSFDRMVPKTKREADQVFLMRGAVSQLMRELGTGFERTWAFVFLQQDEDLMRSWVQLDYPKLKKRLQAELPL